MATSRMERLSNLHKDIRRENEEYRQKIENISIADTLKKTVAPYDFDGSLLAEINELVSLKKVERPHLENNNSKKMVTETIVRTVKSWQADLDKIKIKKHDDNDLVQELKNLFLSNLHDQNKANLNYNEDKLFNDIAILTKKYESQNAFDYQEKFNKKLVDTAINNHDLPYRQMSMEIDKLSNDKINQLKKHWRKAKEKDNKKIAWWVFIIPIAIAIIGLAFGLIAVLKLV